VHHCSKPAFVITLCISQIDFQVMQVLQVSCFYVPSQNGKENILVVGTKSHVLAKVYMAVLWALSAEVF
jgi:hypothetical protein